MTGENQAESFDSHEVASLRRRIAELEQQVLESQQTQELCKALIEHSLQGVVILQDDRIVFANPQLGALIGYTVPELLQLSPAEVAATIHPEDRDAVRQRWQARAGGETFPQHYRFRILRRDGVVRWVEVFAHAIEFKGRPASHAVEVDITDQVIAEQSRHDLEERYRNMVDAAEEGIWAMDEHFRTTFANAHMASMLGYTVEEMIGQPVEVFMFEDQLPDHRAKMENREQGKADRYERRFRRKDGTALWAIVSAVPLMDAEGNFRGSFAMFTDITERRFIEEALRESEAKFRGVIEQSLDGFILLDSLGTVIEWNHGMELITGFQAQEALGKPLWDIQNGLALEEDRRDPSRYDTTRRLVQETLISDASPWMGRLVEREIQRRDGERRFIQSQLFSITINGRRLVCGVMREITEQKRAEQQLQQSEARYRSLFEDSPVAMWEEDLSRVRQYLDALRTDGVTDFRAYFEEHPETVSYCGSLISVRAVNQATLELFKANSKDDLSVTRDLMPGTEAYDPGLVEVFRDEFISFIQGYLHFEREATIKTSPGQTHHVLITVSIAPGYEHTWGQVIVSTVDLTERRHMEEVLRDSEQRFRQLFEFAPLGYQSLDQQGILLEVNQAWLDTLGYSREEVVGRWFGDFLMPDSQAQFRIIFPHFQEIGEAHNLLFDMICKDGAVIVVSFEGKISRDDQGRFQKTHCILSNVTERNRMEFALREAEQRYRTVAEFTYDWEYWEAPDGRLLYVAPSCERITGYPPEWFMSHPDHRNELVVPDDQPLWREHYHHGEAAKLSVLHYRIRRRDGEIRWIEHCCQPVVNELGQFLGYRASNRDVTDRKESEKLLAESEARYRSLFRDAPVSLWEEDFSGVKAYLDRLRAGGVEDFRRYFADHPGAVRECVSQIKVLEVNQVTLDLFEVSKQENAEKGVQTIPEPLIFDKRMWNSFIEEFSAFAEGQTYFEDQTPLYTFGGERLWAFLRVTIAPGYEESWAKVFVSAVDLTAQRRAEEQFRFRATLLAQLSDAVIYTDLDFHIQDWNLGAEMIYGWRADEVIGQRMGVVVPFEFPGTSREAIVAQFRNDGLWQGETIQTCKDGTRLNIFSSVSFLRDENGSPVGIIAVCRDITDRKRIEQAEHEQRALAEALRDTASLLTGTLNLDEVLDRILSHVVRAVPHDAATVMLVSDGTARVVRGLGMAAQGLEEISTFHTPIISLPNYQHMYDTQLPLVVPDTHSSPHWMVLEERAWIHSFAGAPIRVDGQVIGFLNLYSSVPGFFKPECAGPLMVFADQAAVALKNAQLYNEIQAYAAELEARVEERTAQFRQAKEHVETILNSSSDVIILLNNEGLIRQVNPSFNDTFNCDPDHCIGQPFTTLVSPDSVAPVSAALRVAVEQHRPQRLAIEVCYNADIMFDADAALSPIVQANDQVSGVVCSLHDITVLKQTEASLRRMLTREMELGELKSRFIATTSHEFRTPLAIIQSSTDVLMRYADRLSVEQKEKEFQRIRSSIAGMVSLLDDILVISRAERGKLEFTPEPLNLENFCRDFLGVLETTSGRDHHLVFSYSGRAGDVLLDPKLLRHIVNNLISNAIKYSDPRSTVTFNVSCDNNRAILCVKDEGIGIPQADQARLFEPFYRAQNVDTIPGTGLGLAIVKQSVELHRGTIVVESRVGVGTTITVTLPAVQAVTASE